MNLRILEDCHEYKRKLIACNTLVNMEFISAIHDEEGIMSYLIELKPQEMTEKVMKDLEKKGLIYRLCPGHDVLEPEYGEIAWKKIYEADEKFGPHQIISVTVDRNSFSAFGVHSENEEFLLLGKNEDKPLYLLIALCDRQTLMKKIKDETLCKDDFILLHCRFNDPETSFFIMKKGVPHGEASIPGTSHPPSFYVAESRDIDLIKIDFNKFVIGIT